MGPFPTTTRAASVVSLGTMSYAGVHSKVPLAKVVQAGLVNTVWAMLSVDYIWKDSQGWHNIGCSWHWQQWNNRLWGISCCYWALEQDSEGDDSTSLTIETTSGTSMKFICDENSDIMPNDCPNGDFFRKWFCFKRGLGNQLTREILLNIFIFQEDSIFGLRCKQAYGFNSKIYVTVETNW